VAQALPVKIAAVAVQSARYSERPSSTPSSSAAVNSAALSLTVKAEYGWANQRVLVLTVHADVSTPHSPVLVECQVSLRVAFEREDSVSAAAHWSFVKEAGLHIAFPYIRAHIATLTAMGSLGSIMVEPIQLSLYEPPSAP
jgi:preprotein translocase subunit SecB